MTNNPIVPIIMTVSHTSRPSGFALVIALCLLFPATVAHAQSSLKIPSSEEMRALIKEPEGAACATCGIVVSVRLEASTVRGKSGLNAAKNPTQFGGPGGELATVPITGGLGAAKQAGQSGSTAMVHVITVRYDNGAYARVEQKDEPQLRKGDRVRVSDGRADPYQP